MVFNEGMRIDTSTTRATGGGRGLAIGGGLGGLVILLLALFLGVDPGNITSQQGLDTQGVEAPDSTSANAGPARTPTSTSTAA